VTASIEQRKEAEIKRNRAWQLHLNGAPQFAIAAELEITQARVSQFIKQSAKAHPINQLTLEERMAVSEERWNLSEQEIREEIQEQRRSGRIVREVIRLPNGQEQVKVTKTEGVDPSLLRALSTHHDRRARQLNNQMAPDTAVQAVQVNVVRDFLQQGDTAGKLSAEEWNKQAIDV
jgi:predicted transcriptional regulator